MTTREIYEILISKPDLHSVPELHDEILIWRLYKNAYVQAFCNGVHTSIDIIGNSLLSGSMMHWHPDEEDMLEELYNLGRKGNLLVLKKGLLGTSTFYIGPSDIYPLADQRGVHFGKKKWDGGLLVYFEQQDVASE